MSLIRQNNYVFDKHFNTYFKVFEKATEEGAITIDTGVKVTGVAFDSTENIIAVTHDNGIKVNTFSLCLSRHSSKLETFPKTF